MKRKYFAVLRLMAVATVLIALSASAQGRYSIRRHSFTSIGAKSTGGGYSLGIAVGITGTGTTVSGGSFSVASSPWRVLVLQTPGAPLLSVARSNNSVVVSWSVTVDSFVLEEGASLNTPIFWSQTPLAYVTNAASVSVIVRAPVATRIYRLKKQVLP
jgi:hypothetical protein